MLVVWIKYGAILSIVILYSDYNRRTVLRIGLINTQYNGMEQISSTAHLRLYSLHYPGCFRSSLRWLASSIFLQKMQIPDLPETMANWWGQNIPNIHSSQHVAKKSWMIFPAAGNFSLRTTNWEPAPSYQSAVNLSECREAKVSEAGFMLEML